MQAIHSAGSFSRDTHVGEELSAAIEVNTRDLVSNSNGYLRFLESPATPPSCALRGRKRECQRWTGSARAGRDAGAPSGWVLFEPGLRSSTITGNAAISATRFARSCGWLLSLSLIAILSALRIPFGLRTVCALGRAEPTSHEADGRLRGRFGPVNALPSWPSSNMINRDEPSEDTAMAPVPVSEEAKKVAALEAEG